MADLTAERVRELLDYNSDSGVFIWKVQRAGFARVGTVAGSLNQSGYLRIKVDGVRYLAHRLAWLFVHGTWPKCELDHINQIKADNRICNLREVTRSVNLINRPLQKNNKSGFVGVHWDGKNSRWAARIQRQGKNRHLGLFTNIEEARDAFIKAASIADSVAPV